MTSEEELLAKLQQDQLSRKRHEEILLKYSSKYGVPTRGVDEVIPSSDRVMVHDPLKIEPARGLKMAEMESVVYTPLESKVETILHRVRQRHNVREPGAEIGESTTVSKYAPEQVKALIDSVRQKILIESESVVPEDTRPHLQEIPKKKAPLLNVSQKPPPDLKEHIQRPHKRVQISSESESENEDNVKSGGGIRFQGGDKSLENPAIAVKEKLKRVQERYKEKTTTEDRSPSKMTLSSAKEQLAKLKSVYKTEKGQIENRQGTSNEVVVVQPLTSGASGSKMNNIGSPLLQRGEDPQFSTPRPDGKKSAERSYGSPLQSYQKDDGKSSWLLRFSQLSNPKNMIIGEESMISYTHSIDSIDPIPRSNGTPSTFSLI